MIKYIICQLYSCNSIFSPCHNLCRAHGTTPNKQVHTSTQPVEYQRASKPALRVQTTGLAQKNAEGNSVLEKAKPEREQGDREDTEAKHQCQGHGQTLTECASRASTTDGPHHAPTEGSSTSGAAETRNKRHTSAAWEAARQRLSGQDRSPE